MTGNGSLLTGVLRGRMHFGGFVVSDWNAHGQVEGCTVSACPQALLAGVDMYMAPDSWKPIWENLLAETKAGRIPMARIDEAVTRILRVKMRMGLFEAGKPSSRIYGGKWDLLGSAEHRAIAREAVRKSLVLLKNQGVLPIKSNARVLVAGDGADDVARASGGWTITWQGSGLNNGMFPGSTSLWKGISDSVTSAGGSAELSPDGSFKKRPDVAVVVFGEKPYAEFQGDRKSLQLDPELTKPFDTMRRLKAQGIPVVVVMLTGRPLFVNPALNLADAFVVAWLPGTEGAGLADVIIGDQRGKLRFDFTGRLPAAWPRTADMKDGALWPFGYGLTYASPGKAWARLSVDSGVTNAGDGRLFFSAGQPAAGRTLNLRGTDGAKLVRVTTVPIAALGGRVSVTAANTSLQEGARRFTVKSGTATVSVNAVAPANFSREVNGEVLLLVTARVWNSPLGATLSMGCGGNNCRGRSSVSLPITAGYVRYGIPLKCLASTGADMTRIIEPFAMTVRGPADFAISEVRLGTDAERILPCN
jgi:beta-glucosidase